MKTKLFLIAMIVLVNIGNVNAQSSKLKSYKMTVRGSSTLHEWESVVEKLECKASYKLERNTLVELKDAMVRIPVTSIKSTKGKMMDNKTYDAFNYEKNPNITFTLSAARIEETSVIAALKGSLSMAGSTRPIDLQVTYKVLTNGDLFISGSKKIKMTDFKMDPPTAMMGTVKVGDEVTITFELVLSNTNTIL